VLRVAILRGETNILATSLFDELQAETRGQASLNTVEDLCRKPLSQDTDRFLYIPSLVDEDGMIPDLAEAGRVFQSLARAGPGRVVVLSSALVYGTGPGRPALVNEEYSEPGKKGRAISQSWRVLEAQALHHLNSQMKATILRPVTVVPSQALLSRLLSRRWVLTLPGHDPNLQLLSAKDLAQAISRALSQDRPGIYNVAPDQVVPLHTAIRIVRSNRVPVPRTLIRLRKGSETLDYLRYPWTVSNQKIKKELGFVPTKTSLMALLDTRGHKKHFLTQQEAAPDDFGMDRIYIDLYGRTFFKFLCDYYWRTEVKGLEHVPRSGRAVLVGMHRGFMPWDGVMALHLIAQRINRYPRFLIHPSLVKFPFLANFMTKLGGVVACQESADRILESDELLGIFPEGIQGAFTPYREAYKLQAFGRNAFVKMALQHRAPIVPFVTVGSAEIFPILGRIKSKTLNRYTEWPYVPITPTFPILPLPLPAKWHTLFLPPIHVEEIYPAEAANVRSVIKAISLEVKTKMQRAVDEMLSRRRSIFWGSVFEPEGGP
jgi:1-acyl-sn-glycerol-3-phosphate acyltransferase